VDDAHDRRRRDGSIGGVGEGTPWQAHRFIFIGGVHRSGTSYTARSIATNPAVSGFHHTGVQEDEGEHLQSVYPHSCDFGGMGRFAFRPEMHLTEDSPLINDRSRAILWQEWGRHWDLDHPVLLEKSPPNLLKMRFLQALFPNSGQVLVIRHPVSVVLSSLKWRTSLNGLFTAHRIIDHWLAANQIAMADAARIQRLHVLRYEDLIADSDREMARLAAVLELGDEFPSEALDATRNDRNFDDWRALTASSRRGAYFRWIERLYGPRIARFGYSFSATTR
jgi:hypothetical protein